jgi:hypothetical protein
MKTITSGLATWAFLLGGLGIVPGRATAADNALAARARTVLADYCARCHGPDSPGKGGFNYLFDRQKLIDRDQVLPGHAADSPLYERVAKGEMPPRSTKKRPGRDDVALLRRWIEAGAPVTEVAAAPPSWVGENDVIARILADLRTYSRRHRRFLRYLTLANEYNAGLPGATLQRDRRALSKLLNSLSWHPRITRPSAIDRAGTILRIDLRDLQWSADQWNKVLAVYPYRLAPETAEFRSIAAATGCELPYVRADWFVATASRAPLYYDLLQMPTFDRELERQVRVDVVQDIQDDRVIRAGFNGSGVARNNRILERHDAGFGAYWRSYDFSDNTDRQNIFDHPLGPIPGQNSFEQAGGEIIFHLPNGLQAYMLVDANGRRLDRASVEIVSDPKRPDRAVEAGLSCMSCHAQGINFKADQIRAHVNKNPSAFSRADTAAVRSIYVSPARFKALTEEDTKRYRRAVEKSGAAWDEEDAVTALTLRYEGEVDLAAAAAELGLKPAEFQTRLRRSDTLARVLGRLRVNGGSVQRQVFLTSFPDVVREFHLLGDAKAAAAGNLLDPAAQFSPFQGHAGQVLAIAFSPDGKRALSGAADNTARLWDVATGREIRPLEGHTGEVLGVAFSPDGRRALTGSSDRTVRLWDLSSGRELHRFEGHTERVGSVAFSPDGKRALSGSWDQTFSLWDLETGKELRRLGGHDSYVTSVAFSPDGKRALSGGYDHTVRLWDLDAGREVRRLDGAIREVYCVAFSPDGRYALAGGNDHVVRLWKLASGGQVRRFEGHAGAVVQVRFSPDGKRVLSAESRYQGGGRALRVWDRATGRLLHRYGDQSATAWSAAFSPDGRQALTAGSDHGLRLWDLSKD